MRLVKALALFLVPLLLAPFLAVMPVAHASNPPVQLAGATADWAAWEASILQGPPSEVGCFVAYYGNSWQAVPCGVAPLTPMMPVSPSSTSPSVVGNGHDEAANSSSTLIGRAVGSFQTSGLTGETGGPGCETGTGAPDCYSVQLNTQFFNISGTAYTDGKSTTAWEQFVYDNSGSLYIQYWLLGYHHDYGSCPSTAIPGGTSWGTSGDHCYGNSASIGVPITAATNLASLSLAAYANYLGSGTDIIVVGFSGLNFYAVVITDGVVDLFQNWHDSEFNVIGDASGSQAIFNDGTSIQVLNLLADQSGNPITPSCSVAGWTGETNNLYLGPCSSISSGIAFTEASMDFSLSSSSPAATALRGGTVTYPITASLKQGTAGSVTLSVLGLPSGATAAFTTNPVTPTATSTLSVTTSSSGGLGDFVLTIQGQFGLLIQTTTVNLHVYDFTLVLSDETVLRGGSAAYTVTSTLTAGSSTTGVPAIQLAVSGLPSDATAHFGSGSITPTFGGASTTLSVKSGGPPSGSLGDFTVTVTGTAPGANGGSRSGSAGLHIYDFSVTTSPLSLLSVLTTGSNTYSVTVALTPGSSTTGLPTIALSLTGLPSGATGVFSPGSGTAAGYTSTLTISTTHAPSGTYELTVTGSDGRSPEGGTRVSQPNLNLRPPTLVILTPAQALKLVMNQVKAFQYSKVLNSDQAFSLTSKLNQAIADLTWMPPTDHDAYYVLNAFVNKVKAFQTAGILTPAQADMLLGGPLGVYAIMAAIPS